MNLHHAFQQGAAGAGNLVEDDAGRAGGGKVRVAGHNAAQLRQAHILIVVVEDQARCADVEAVVFVVRQPSIIGGDDVDHRHPVGGNACLLRPQRDGLDDDQRTQRAGQQPAAETRQD